MTSIVQRRSAASASRSTSVLSTELRRRARLRSVIGALGVLAALFLAAAPGSAQEGAPAGPTAEERQPALVIREGSVARSEIVAIGRDLLVEGEALRDVAAVSGSVRVSGRVGGDVIVLGGSARLLPTARIEGDVLVVGGHIEAAAGARIAGRSVSYPTLSSAWLTLLEGPALGLDPLSPLVLGAKLALVAAWLALTLLLFATSGRELLATSEAVQAEPFRNFFVGLTGVLALVLSGLFFSAFAAALVGVPLLVLVVLLAMLLKLWGMVAVFHALGDWLGRRILKRPLRALDGAILGLVVLGVLKLVPWTGTWVWTAATLIGVGASLTTKFGRRQAWFQPDELDALAPRPVR